MAIFIDIGALRAFSVVASELNMRRAAAVLNISEPPLSRKIKNLENQLGTPLFVRRSYGLELTREGREVVEIVQPLLTMQEDVQKKLAKFSHAETCRLGLTTAFERTVYEPVIAAIKTLDGGNVAIKMAPSIQLVNDVVKGIIAAAWVALPIAHPGISIQKVPYSETLMAVMPESWPFISKIGLDELSNRPFFWFAPARNPFWHERMGKIFKSLGFKPIYIEEPLEYEVLLGRIAAGEGWTLIPESFMAIHRKGIKYVGIQNLPPLDMGIIYKNEASSRVQQKLGGVFKIVPSLHIGSPGGASF